MNFNAWIQGLSDRERVMLVVALAVVVIAALFLGITEPMSIERERRLNQLDEARATAQYVAEQSSRATELRALQSGRRQFPNDESLIRVIDQSLNRAGLNNSVRRVTPNGETRAAIMFDDVAVDGLIAWLTELRDTTGIRVTQISVNPVQERGRANVTLELTTT